MHIKNQLSLTHNILYGIMSLAVLLAAFGAGNLPPARAQGTTAKTPTGAVVSLSAEKGFFGAAREVTLHVTITNLDEPSIRVLRWLIPAEGLTEPLFTVTRDGEPVAYLGMLVKRAAPTEQDYITLAAGESLSRAVNLSDYYDLSVSGNYAIQYDVASVELYAKADNNAGRLASNTLNLFIEGRAARAPEAIPAQMVSGTNTFNGCSASRQTDLINARNAASTYTTEAMAYFSANKQGARYTTWFGVYDLSRYNTVSSHYSSISTAVDTANPMNFDCTCTESYYAYVYPNSPYNIYLCNAFWSAPMTGTDSKAGALIHEITHFNVVIGTDDYVYGQSGAQALAISNPAQAIMNADNHEYFAENNPPLEITPTFTISGNAGVAGATLTYTSSSTMADGSGNYSFGVPSGWSGTVTPSKAGYTFTPPNRTYTNVVSNQSGQNYTATQTGGTNLLQDPSFEAYTPNPYWLEASINYGSPLCTITDCGTGGGSAGPRTGSVWSWFGGTDNNESASLSQNVVFPNGSATLSFYLWIGAAGPGSDTSDVFTSKIDGVTVFSANATQINSYPTYTLVSVNVSAFANGAAHSVTFSSVTTGQTVNFNLDDVSLSTVATGTFADVPTSYWARDWIVRLYNAGITSGCSTNPMMYCPDDPVTRAQMAIFILRGIHGSTYIPSEVAKEAVFIDAQSTTGPIPPLGSANIESLKYVAGSSAKLISNLPAYIWRHGCGPTAAGMVIGYWDHFWDAQGYDWVINGSATTQTSMINEVIASSIGTQNHYSDYSLPLDDPSTGLLADKSELPVGDEHPNNSIADYMYTSRSWNGSYYGSSWFSDVSPALIDYLNMVNPGEFIVNSTTSGYSDGTFNWNMFKAEIDAGHPMVLLVDSDGDGNTDHFISAIGYDDSTGLQKYAAYNTWDALVHWYDFGPKTFGKPWGIHGGTSLSIVREVSTTTFTDVPPTYWAAAWINRFAAEGITTGCGGGLYCPDNPVTRAQMAIFLLRAKHGATYTPPSATGLFWDVPTTYWAANWIEQLAAEGITSGCGGGNYCPDNNVSRAEMAVFLVRTFNLP